MERFLSLGPRNLRQMSCQASRSETEGGVGVKDGIRHGVEYESCADCDGTGVNGHDCGEDTCCCLYPEDNVSCDYCQGAGVYEVVETKRKAGVE